MASTSRRHSFISTWKSDIARFVVGVSFSSSGSNGSVTGSPFASARINSIFFSICSSFWWQNGREPMPSSKSLSDFVERELFRLQALHDRLELPGRISRSRWSVAWHEQRGSSGARP